MQGIVRTLVEELNRLKAAGVRTVPVSDEALAALRRAVASTSQPAPANTQAAEEVAPQSTAKPPAPAEERPKPEPAAAMPAARKAEAAPRTLPPSPVVNLPEGDKLARWTWLRDRVLGDPVCRANVREGKQVVFGVGDIDATIMFVGEAPGAEEEVRGEPFVGPAGQLLTRMIGGMGLKREAVYIANIMNWRPQLPAGQGGEQRGNREPNEEEMSYCLPFLRAQVEVVRPRLLVALGATAARGLLGPGAFKTLGEVRGRWHDYVGIPLMVTYHPSYLLRKEAESKVSEKKAKRAAWEDLLKIMERADLPISDRQRGYYL